MEWVEVLQYARGEERIFSLSAAIGAARLPYLNDGERPTA
jgi:hypothetical protein